MDIFKRPAVIIIIFVAIIIAVIWSYYNQITMKKKAAEQAALVEQQAASSYINLANIDPAEFDEVIKKEFAIARSKAEEVDVNHKLSAIQVILPSLELNSGETRYIFSSPENKDENWTITFSQSTTNFLRAAVPKNDFMGQLSNIDTSLWKFSYVTAIQIVENNGGREWRETNGLDNIELILKHGGENNWLIWNVTYNSGNQTLIKNIDSSSGKIIE